MNQFLSEHLNYPPDARDAGVEGRVVISFVVMGDGTVTNVTVAKSVHPDIDSEAVRVVRRTSGHWTPGRKNGKPAPTLFSIPITFATGRGPSAPVVDAHFFKGVEAYENRDYPAAIRHLEKALVRQPENMRALDMLMLVQFVSGASKTACSDLNTVWMKTNQEKKRAKEMSAIREFYCGSTRPPDSSTPPDIPLFRGGARMLRELTGTLLVYPKTAEAQCIQGTVVVRLGVSKEGSVENIVVTHSVDPLLDSAAVRMARKLSPFWYPALDSNGQPATGSVLLPVTFSTDDPKCHDDSWYYREGVRRYEANKLEEALALFQRAYRMNYANFDALYNLAAVKLTLGNSAEACEHIRHLKEAGYADAETFGKQYCGQE